MFLQYSTREGKKINAELLKRHIRYRGLTNEKVAEQLGVTRPRFQVKMKYGKLSLADLRKLKEMLEIPDDYFLEIFFRG